MNVVKVFAVASALALASAGLPCQAGILPPEDRAVYREAFALAHHDKFDQARVVARRTNDKVLAKVVAWMDFVRPGTTASFADITAFMRDNPNWPQTSNLERRAEEAITAATPDDAVLAWFAATQPLTVDGRAAHGEALLRTGQTERGVKVLRDAWVSGNFGVLQERQFLSRHHGLLRDEDHVARLDRLLWDHQESAAQRMILRVDEGYRLVAQARLALMAEKGGADGAVARVPKQWQDDPGLLFERVHFRRVKDMDAEAVALLRHPNANKVRPEMWWPERAVLARHALSQGLVSEAYQLARDHGMSDGSAYADAEWLAGWIALRFLDDKEVALGHFGRLYDRVQSPMSRARGAYWAGRAAEAMGNGELSAKWYGLASQNVTSFYGQLAAMRQKREGDWALPSDPLPTADDIDTFEKQELVKVARILGEMDEADAAKAFVIRLVDLARTPGQRALTASLASALGRADVAVSVARRSERDGVTLVSSGWPVPPLHIETQTEKALVLALIRQESAFHFEAVSGAGARGLMQLLPTTAEKVAKALKVHYTKDKLTDDPSFNVKVGSAYLTDLISEFNGSYILALAAYNAGPSRARRWVRDFGDPRMAEVDAVDWIELIPFTETRNYVQRVMESLQVYRRRLGATEMALTLERDIKRASRNQ